MVEQTRFDMRHPMHHPVSPVWSISSVRVIGGLKESARGRFYG